MLGYLVACVDFSLKLGILDSDMNDIKYYLQNINLYARDLDLLQSGNTILDGETIISNMQQISDSFSSIMDDFDTYKEMLDLNAFYHDIFLVKNLEVWDLNNGQQVSRKMNYIDCLKRFIFSSSILYSKDLKYLNLTDPDVYFLYQNSIGDMMKASDRNIQIFQDNEKTYIENIRMNLQFFIIGVVIVLLSAIGFIAYRLHYVQLSSSRVWQFIYSVSSFNLIELQRKSLERLCNVHMIESEARINRISRQSK